MDTAPLNLPVESLWKQSCLVTFLKGTDSRILRAFRRYGIVTVTDLIRLTTEDLLEMNNLGPHTLTRIREVLTAHGFKLARRNEETLPIAFPIQPRPSPNGNRPVWELVIEDMVRRDHVGRARYGTPLQAGNGRDALQDAYEEALDLAVYLRQAIEERNSARG